MDTVYGNPVTCHDIVGINARLPVEAKEPIGAIASFEFEDEVVIVGIVLVIGYTDKPAFPRSTTGRTRVEHGNVLTLIPTATLEDRRDESQGAH